MALKKNRYILQDLDWLERKLLEWRNYIDAPENKWNILQDRFARKSTQNGGVTDVLAATKEQQQDSMRKAAKDIFDLLMQINDKRKEEEQSKLTIETKGNVEIPDAMKR